MWSPEVNRFTIIKMNIKDLDEVLPIAASTRVNPWSENMFIGEMRNPFSYCFMIKMRKMSNYPVVGFVCFRNIKDESELLNICVHPEYRQMGIGKKLMQFYIGFCIKKKIRTFYLEVNSSNRSALHLYQSFSYELLAVRKKFYQGEFDGLLMAKKA